MTEKPNAVHTDQVREKLSFLLETDLHLTRTRDEKILKRELANCLKKNGIHNQSNLYRFIPSQNQSQDYLIKEGTDHPNYNAIFAYKHKDIFCKDTLIPAEYLFNYGSYKYSFTCMIAVFDESNFTNDSLHHFTYLNAEKKPKALKAVIYIKPLAK